MHGEYHVFADEGTNAAEGCTSKLKTQVQRNVTESCKYSVVLICFYYLHEHTQKSKENSCVYLFIQEINNFIYG
jgi:hypothetical protein